MRAASQFVGSHPAKTARREGGRRCRHPAPEAVVIHSRGAKRVMFSRSTVRLALAGCMVSSVGIAPVAAALPRFASYFDSYEVVHHPHSPYVLDFDHDGKQDVLVLNAYTGGEISFFPGRGDGTL